jgi:hypothetical protein
VPVAAGALAAIGASRRDRRRRLRRARSAAAVAGCGGPGRERGRPRGAEAERQCRPPSCTGRCSPRTRRTRPYTIARAPAAQPAAGASLEGRRTDLQPAPRGRDRYVLQTQQRFIDKNCYWGRLGQESGIPSFFFGMPIALSSLRGSLQYVYSNRHHPFSYLIDSLVLKLSRYTSIRPFGLVIPIAAA